MRALKVEATSKNLASDIWTAVNPHLPDLGDMVQLGDLLVALWHRPEKTAGGIILTDKSRGEDIYQGKAGLIIKMGPMAFQDDETTTPPIKWPIKPKIGDWVLFRVSDGWPFVLGETHCRIINERGIRMILNRPDVVM